MGTHPIKGLTMCLEAVRNKTYAYGRCIDLDNNSAMYPVFVETSDILSDGASIYVENEEYHYVITERGTVRKHYHSNELDTVLYYVFSNITFSMAKQYELDSRKENEDFRRLLWNKQLELLERIKPEFKNLRNKEIERILTISPFEDKR